MSQKPFFMTNNEALMEAGPDADLLHPGANSKISDDSCTETQYFGFNIPEAKIHALTYMWYHPNLKTVMGGVMVFKGEKKTQLAAEIFDLRAYMHDRVLDNDLHEFRLDNGYGVKILEPNKRFHITYNDAKRGNQLDLISEGVTPVVMFGDGNHFEQGMHVTGKLKLRGEEYDVNCYNVRDRSWGKARPETNETLPPLNWMTCCFGDDLVFNCSLFDHEGSQPNVTGKFAMPVENALTGGWVSRDGKVMRVVSAHKTLTRNLDSHFTKQISLGMVLEDGSEMKAEGRTIAACPLAPWPNMQSNIALVRWEMDGRIGYGDSQDVIWNDYAYAHQNV